MTRLAAVFLQTILGCAAAAQTLETPNPQVLAAAGVDRSTLARVKPLVQEGMARLTPLFPGTPNRPFTVTAHATIESVSKPIRDALHEGTAGVALLRSDAIHLFLDESRLRPPHDLRTVVDHELVHILLDQYVGPTIGPHVSRWFHEGLAQELSGGPYIGMSEDDLVLTVLGNRLLRFPTLHRDFPDDRSGLRRAYAQSFSFVGFLRRKFGLELLLNAARASKPNGGFQAGFVAVTETALVEHEDEWRNYLRHGSGAQLRFVLQNCFAYVMIGAFVLLALAGIRRWRREDRVRKKLESEDEAIDARDSPGAAG